MKCDLVTDVIGGAAAPREPKGATLLLEAAQLAVNSGGCRDDEHVALVEKARAKVPDAERGTGGELIQNTLAASYPLNTLDYPDFIAADASDQRMQLAKKAGALALGVDTADTIKAANTVELMLAHQLAATHAGAMRLLGQINTLFHDNVIAKDDAANLRATRLAGAAARLLGAYQSGILALDRLRTGGRQTVVVQHVQVNEGGQAVVAGRMKASRQLGGGSTPPKSVARSLSKNSGRSPGAGSLSASSPGSAATAASPRTSRQPSNPPEPSSTPPPSCCSPLLAVFKMRSGSFSAGNSSASADCRHLARIHQLVANQSGWTPVLIDLAPNSRMGACSKTSGAMAGQSRAPSASYAPLSRRAAAPSTAAGGIVARCCERFLSRRS